MRANGDETIFALQESFDILPQYVMAFDTSIVAAVEWKGKF